MKEQPFEMAAHSLVGYAALDLREGVEELLTAEFPNYHPERFAPVNIKISFSKEGFSVTLYAYEKNGKMPAGKGRLPVKKFKKRMKPIDFAAYVLHFAVSLSCDDFDINRMRVVNK
ncbi:hypothetical protein A8C56_13780 [Niabella ginsenosidivorans]|uniref:Uncharacterized protein n=1 Tax=Niabella ginsenosidivorans TaxID=1176587 RepID=A0A1A9I5F9_9BACT|nr:hypothetical protein [Niabella ginsenosidivorans]ANH81901.1 hypothetical protein A8C56_13780 [Niabella ginsenosidivorans]